MRIVRNIGYINQQRRRARLSAVVGFLALVGTFPFAFIYSGQPAFVVGTYVLLLGGFILFNHGMQQIGKWSNTARHVREDLALDNHLNELPDRYVLVHYGRPNKDVVDHALVHPGGVLVITTRDFPGAAKSENDNWRKSGSIFSRAFMISGPQLGNPSKDADAAVARVEQALTNEGIEADIESAIVFTSSWKVPLSSSRCRVHRILCCQSRSSWISCVSSNQIHRYRPTTGKRSCRCSARVSNSKRPR